VIFSHLQIMAGFDQGKSAVVGFFLLTGYVMTMLVNKYYLSPDRVPWFYFDRIMRLYPQYLFYLAATVVFLWVANPVNSWTALCTPSMYAVNVLLLPLYNFHNNLPLDKCTINPPAWSLALELLFYGIVPFIAILWSRFVLLAVAVFSLSYYGQAYLGTIDTDGYVLRSIFGTLFIFLAGMSFANDGRLSRIYRWGVWVGAIILMGMLLVDQSLGSLNSNKEVLIGILVGIPGLALTRRIAFTRSEQLAGNLSYGMYLNHFVLIMLLVKIGFLTYHDTRTYHNIAYCGVVVISAAVSYLSYSFIEKPVLLWRRSLRMGQVQPVANG
jgi:peptidoglycan/LPS O-acetylase OafA/YrhL